VEWKPLEIHPETPPAGRPRGEALSGPRFEAARAHLARMAAEEGIEGFGSPDLIANSRLALQAAEYAQDVEPARFDAFSRALFHAYFVDGENIGDRVVLRRLAGEAGLDVAGLDAALDEGRYLPALEESQAEAHEYGINGTPSFIVGRYLVVGAQPTAVLDEALQLAAKERREGIFPRAGEE
jgi:predicted DsbA family dithiol-disulfide isomerase